ncbi:MAG: 16S rRNA (adenine(1518)-N(6)/adenine(1519)-N(6))-dimethyltransferase RsmA [Bacteroidota bacterium]
MQNLSHVRPKKSLGQHFLKDAKIAQKIVHILDASPLSQAVVEIGPGTGALTKWLINHTTQPIYLIETDEVLVAKLRKDYPQLGNHIIQADFLKFPLANITKGPISIISNFPYNISSQILFKIWHQRHQVQEVVGMLQKEVAERICAQPGNKTYGLMSVLLQTFYHINYCFTVDASVFNPPPKVTSAVVQLKRNQLVELPCEEGFFLTLVKTVFGKRRKMLRNTLSQLVSSLEAVPQAMLTQRPEELHCQDFIALAHTLASYKKSGT